MSRRPFLYFPLRDHFEELRRVHRLNRYGAGRAMQPQRVTAGRDRGSDRNRVKQTRPLRTSGRCSRTNSPRCLTARQTTSYIAQQLSMAVTEIDAPLLKKILKIAVRRIEVQCRAHIQPYFKVPGVRMTDGSPPLPAETRSRGGVRGRHGPRVEPKLN